MTEQLIMKRSVLDISKLKEAPYNPRAISREKF